MSFEVIWREDAMTDLKPLPRNIAERVWRAVGQRLATEPAKYGTRLRRSLVGLWKLRVGDWRVIYILDGQRVTIWAVVHRREAYPEMER